MKVKETKTSLEQDNIHTAEGNSQLDCEQTPKQKFGAQPNVTYTNIINAILSIDKKSSLDKAIFF